VSGPGNSVGGEWLAVECVERALRAASVLRGGVEVELDPEHVAVAVRSERHLRLDGRSLAGFAPLSRYWRAADGWVRTHANYPWHRQALLSALHTGPGMVGEVIAELPAAEVEARVYAAGGLAVAVRTRSEWRALAGDAAEPIDRDEDPGGAPAPQWPPSRP
jgi:hypothetical protein